MVNFAVIGIGRMGSVHATNLYIGKVSGAKLVCVCDIKQKALDKFTKRHSKVKTYLDYKDMLDVENIDAVIIATEHYFHADIGIDCLKKGKHILVEKPLSVTTTDAKRILNAAKEQNIFAAVMYNQRTNPLYKRAETLVKSGAIGKVQRLNYIITDWYRSQAYYNQGGWRASLKGEGGGMLMNQCVHQLDLIQWIQGMPKSVDARMCTKGRKITTENDVTAIFDYGNGVYLSFSASTHELRGTNRLEIAGDNGRIVIDGLKMRVHTLYKDEPTVNAETKFGYGFVLRKTKKYSHTFGFGINFLRGGQQLNIVKNFANAIMGKEELISPIQDGLNAVELINGIYLSAWTGKKVDLPIDDALYLEHFDKKLKEEEILIKER
jgi:predicted dehydrogenase